MSKFLSSNELWDQVYENICNPHNPRGQKHLSFQKDYGEMHIDHYNTGFGIRYASIRALFQDDIVAENTNSHDCNFLCFNTANNIYMQDAIKNQKVKWISNVCWSGQQFDGHRCNSIYPKSQNIQLHHISFDTRIFQEIIANNENFHQTKIVYQGEYIDVNFNNYINMQQKTLLNELLYTSSLHGNKLQELYLESKLLDLVYTSINAVDLQQNNQTQYLNKKDIECLYRAKEILLANLLEPPSLKELAYKSAINEFKLKKGFKELFGTTVYGMLQEVRLEYAKKLLYTNDINVQEAAHMVGYKNLSHFSKIFKERYGKLPIEFKKYRAPLKTMI